MDRTIKEVINTIILPELTGTPKQVNCANQIRARWIDEAIKTISEVEEDCQKALVSGKIDDAGTTIIKRGVDYLHAGVFKILTEQCEAKYWIDYEVDSSAERLNYTLKMIQVVARDICEQDAHATAYVIFNSEVGYAQNN